jgi:hypothetical protein
MAGYKTVNSENTHANQHAFLSSNLLRDSFLDWLLKGNSRKYTPVVLVNSIDKISEYTLQKKICVVSL